MKIFILAPLRQRRHQGTREKQIQPQFGAGKGGKDEEKQLGYNRPVHLTLVLGKTLETLIKDEIIKHLEK